MKTPKITAEDSRVAEKNEGKKPWLRWGPYLSERQWGTVREDYSEHGTAWDYFPHDHARSRTYRWGEDGIAGISDHRQRLCFALALWNGKDPILKERLFGLTGNEGNHGEDVKELYYYLDSTPTHSYMKHLYKYPQVEFPYADLVNINRSRSKHEGEFEILDTGIFHEGNYFDVFTEYAKADAEDILIKITIHNRGAKSADITVLPTLWFRNQWTFGDLAAKPSIQLEKNDKDFGLASTQHAKLGNYHFYFESAEKTLFTENQTNTEKLYNFPNQSPFVKDAFHRAVVDNDYEFLANKTEGTKFAPLYHYHIPAGESVTIRLRLSKDALKKPFGNDFDKLFQNRLNEADDFYQQFQKSQNADLANIQRQAFAGMLWSKQFFHIDITRWLNGDPGQPAPPEKRKMGRNHHWQTLYNEDVISMPDKWEYPWYAAWDLAFHCVPLAMVDTEFAKDQLLLFLREWYMHPNGQIPAYEWAFGDVNPPVHAWACLQVYKMEEKKTGKGDLDFLKRVFKKLILNFTWWVNRKDKDGNNVFEGGFLGLDNIGIFDRSSHIPGGGHLEQADGTSWMAMYSLNMLEMALLIAQEDNTFEDIASKFFEHFVHIADSLNRLGENWTGAWDEDEGFFYDILALPGERFIPLKVRSLVGLSTLFAVFNLKKTMIDKCPEFFRRLKWFKNYRNANGWYRAIEDFQENDDLLLSLIHKDKLAKLLQAMLDEQEFLSIGGIRSLSKIHEDPYIINIEGQDFGVSYVPGESDTYLFGGNSNWRGPIWLPMNYLLIQSLRTYGEYYESEFKVEYPLGSGKYLCLQEIADELSLRLISIFQKDAQGKRLVNGKESIYQTDPHFQDLILFYEYFHGDNGRGVGASHQTGWTGVVAELIDRCGWKV
jgi:hypothetical protein